MEEGSSTLAMEDDGSLLIISRISDGSLEELKDFEMEGDLLTAINLKSTVLPKEVQDSQEGSGTNSGEVHAHHQPHPVPEPEASLKEQPQSDLGIDVFMNNINQAEVVEGQEGLALDEEDDNDMEELNKLLEVELLNLQSIKLNNENLRKMIASAPSTPAPVSTVSTATQTVPDSTSGPTTGRPNFMRNSLSHLTNFRRRRQLQRPSPSTPGGNFLQDYYRSLDSFARYLILATILGFLVGFLLLSWHGSQIHRNDMELFKLKEKQYLSQQVLLERSQEKHESFRESLIHQRYEESRECQSTLKSYLQGRHNLVEKYSNLQKESRVIQNRLEEQVESQQKEILQLQLRIQDYQKEMAQSLSSSYTQILFGFLNVLKNRGFQVAVGGFVAVAGLFFVMVGGFSK